MHPGESTRHNLALCASHPPLEEEVGEMDNRLRRFPGTRTLVLGAATLTLLWLPSPAHAQSAAAQPSAATQDRQAPPGDDITRRDLAQFDRFLDSHREIADQLRRTPSLIDDPQFLESHPELSAYLQEHPGVKQEISEQPGTFMRLEDLYARDKNLRDRDASLDRDADRRDVASFDRFLDDHREIAEQVRKDPSLLDNRTFVDDHPALQTYLQDNPGVRDQLSRDPNAFMRLADAWNRDANMGDRDAGADRDAWGRNVASFDRFLDGHREIAEQVRRDPSLCDNRDFVHNHPALEAYLRDNPGVRDQLSRDPNAFMRQQDAWNRDANMRDRDPMRDRMADFGGFLGSHSDIEKDLSRNPSVVRDHDYVQDHAELDAWLTAHPDVRAELMANPDSFVHGAQQYETASPSGTSGGVSGRGAGTTGSSTGTSTTGTTAGASTDPSATTHPKPNQ
jgi:hypothetical protein